MRTPLLSLTLAFATAAAAQASNVDKEFPRAWAENVGWIALGDGTPADGVRYANVDAARFDACKHRFSGAAWGENVGWIRLEGAAGAPLAVFHATNDLGFGKAGSGGVTPTLCGYGHTGAGDLSTLLLRDAAPGAPVLLVVGLAQNPTPYVGGFLVPVPIQLAIPLATDATGQLLLPAPGAAGPPVGVTLQFVIGDPGASFGQSLSNAMTLTLGV